LRYVFVREHACDNVTVKNVMPLVSICRSVLERRFVRALGHTLGQEIRRVKLHRAAEMLRETPMKLDSISSYCGYQNRSHFSHAFKKEFGITGSQYRQQQSS
jgi:LacI family transcriptional regulator